MPLRQLLRERREAIQLCGSLGDWQPITIKFTGEVVPRERSEVFKGSMFAAFPGDLIFSKIDARNGAVGLVPDGLPKVVVTSEYPVLIVDRNRLRPRFLELLLRAEHFQADLQRQASGTSGRKRVTAEGFLSLEVPLPDLAQQDALVREYTAAIERAVTLEREAQQSEGNALRAVESALGLMPLRPAPSRPLFVSHFKDLDRWSHEGVLRASHPSVALSEIRWPVLRLGDLIADLENGWSPKCYDYPAHLDRWGVLKVGAVSFGTYDENQNKELPTYLNARLDYEVKKGDVLISRANVARYVGACVHVRTTRAKLMLCDKIFRVRFRQDTLLLPGFLAEAMRLPMVREQIENRLTGTSPTMKNISKPALLDLCLPLPSLAEQERLVESCNQIRDAATVMHINASSLRQSVRMFFEAALFEPGAESGANDHTA